MDMLWLLRRVFRSTIWSLFNSTPLFWPSRDSPHSSFSFPAQARQSWSMSRERIFLKNRGSGAMSIRRS